MMILINLEPVDPRFHPSLCTESLAYLKSTFLILVFDFLQEVCPQKGSKGTIDWEKAWQRNWERDYFVREIYGKTWTWNCWPASCCMPYKHDIVWSVLGEGPPFPCQVPVWVVNFRMLMIYMISFLGVHFRFVKMIQITIETPSCNMSFVGCILC